MTVTLTAADEPPPAASLVPGTRLHLGPGDWAPCRGHHLDLVVADVDPARGYTDHGGPWWWAQGEDLDGVEQTVYVRAEAVPAAVRPVVPPESRPTAAHQRALRDRAPAGL